MDDDINIRKLVEFIFIKKLKITSDMTAPDSSFPTCLQANNFPEKLRYILLTKQAMVCEKYRHIFGNYRTDKSITHEDALKGMMTACLFEHAHERKPLGSFITTCSLLRYFGKLVFELHWSNYLVLSCDFIMELYGKIFKKSFGKCGGFQRLVEYIHHHEYHALNLDVKDLAFYEHSGYVSAKTAEKLQKESEMEQAKEKAACFRGLDMNDLYYWSEMFARNVLNTTTVQVSTSGSGRDPNQESVPNQKENTKRNKIKRRKRVPKSKPLEKACSGNSSLNPDSETTDFSEQKDVSWFENIAQTVRKYNNLEITELLNSDDLKKAEKILSHLESSIETLLVVLDDYDKE